MVCEELQRKLNLAAAALELAERELADTKKHKLDCIQKVAEAKEEQE